MLRLRFKIVARVVGLAGLACGLTACHNRQLSTYRGAPNTSQATQLEKTFRSEIRTYDANEQSVSKLIGAIELVSIQNDADLSSDKQAQFTFRLAFQDRSQLIYKSEPGSLADLRAQKFIELKPLNDDVNPKVAFQGTSSLRAKCLEESCQRVALIVQVLPYAVPQHVKLPLTAGYIFTLKDGSFVLEAANGGAIPTVTELEKTAPVGVESPPRND